MKIIDCHTHLVRDDILKEFWDSGFCDYAISIQMLETIRDQGDKFWNVAKDKKVFVIDSLDYTKGVYHELRKLEDRLKTIDDLVGIKIYLGYQPLYADDKRLWAIYEFAAEHNLTVVYHCGAMAKFIDGASTKYCDTKRIAKVAEEFKKVNFVISHLDYPNFKKTAHIITKLPNCYSCISGMYETPCDIEKSMKTETKRLEKLRKQFPMIHKKLMFGSDFYGNSSYLPYIKEYIDTAKAVWSENELEDLFFNTALSAYPKLTKLI